VTADPSDVRDVAGGLAPELRRGDGPTVVLRQGDQAIRVHLALVYGAADPSASLGFAALTTGRTGLAGVPSRGAGGQDPKASVMR
jgi:hypothetical protein